VFLLAEDARSIVCGITLWLNANNSTLNVELIYRNLTIPAKFLKRQELNIWKGFKIATPLLYLGYLSLNEYERIAA
jgi:hypothetical protein